LYNAGGPTPSGSMRDVRIIRHDQIYRRVGLHRCHPLRSTAPGLGGSNAGVVFVPPIGKTVAVTGEVHRPAVYELRPEERFHDLVRLAGGVRSTALLDRVRGDRIIPVPRRGPLTGRDRV